MGRKVFTSILTIMSICSYAQKNNLTSEVVDLTYRLETSLHNNKKLSQDPNLNRYIYSDTTYTSFTGNGITIQNSFPKGGMIEPEGKQYFDASGMRYGFASFWTRIINNTNLPLELNIKIPASSFAIFTHPEAFLRLFLPPQKVELNKLSEINYGLTNMKSYLDANFYKASELQKTINPNEEHIFFLATLSYGAVGTPRAAMTLKEQNLFYSMSLAPDGSGTIPIGKITFKK
ncbi:hypothetical protein [Cytophaga sp. FL35]|uniref:hypothetical protein n=1 Tax=Cytophaga sp. FL35 TaxID=1904456 RepID=UPI0016536858|nr:hypothetical protein [Cytophaga sp. FL35]MBC7000304.1 hypothetical protein [Cytophaga sp. FL35]